MHPSLSAQQALYTCAPVGLLYADLQGQCLSVNPYYQTLTGLSLAEAQGMGWLQAIHPDDRARALQTWQQLRHTQAPHSAEYRLIRPDGSLRWVMEQLAPASLPDGAITAYIGAYTDISALKQQAETLRLQHLTLEAALTEHTQALRESEIRFSGILDTARDAIIAINQQQIIVLFNQGAEHIFGYSAAEVLGKSIDLLIPARFVEAHRHTVQHFMHATEMACRMDDPRKIWGRRKNGEEFPAEGTASKLQHRGQVLFTAILRDISRYEATEKARQDSHQRYRNLFENSPIPLWEEDFSRIWQHRERLEQAGLHDYRAYFEKNPAVVVQALTLVKILDVNQSCLALFEAPDKTTLYDALEAVFIEETFWAFQTLLIGLCEGQQRVETETVIHTLRGHKRYCVLNLSLLPNTEEPWSRVLISMMDITQRRTTELDLELAKTAAEAANQAKSEFLASISHEVRTPLNSVLGFAQLLERDPLLNPVQQGYIKKIHQSGVALLTLMNDIIDMAKLETRRLQLHPRPFHLPQVLKNIVDMYQLRAAEAGLRFNYQPPNTLPLVVYADENRLRQVLINLLGNAIKFTQQGEVTFKIYRDNDNLSFHIEDTGSGIATEQLELIFQPFQQGGEHRHLTPGSGLGLPLSLRFLEMMNSRLSVRSTVGKGSLFWFQLNLPEVDEQGAVLIDLHHEKPVDTAYVQTVETPIDSKLKIPPQAWLERCYDLALLGDVEGIYQQITALSALDDAYLPVIKKLKSLTEDFQVQKIRALIKSYLQESS